MAGLIDRSKDTGRTLSICALLIAVTLASFWPVLHNGFTSLDDLGYVTNNPHVVTGLTWPNLVWAFQVGYSGNWHPLTWFSHMLDAQIFGLNPTGHHLTSLLLHVANALLLFLVLKRMTGATWRSGFVAALFAVHPLHVESVAWIAERKDVLSTFFFMLTLWSYARYVQSKVQSPLSKAPAVQPRMDTDEHGLPKISGRLPLPRDPLDRLQNGTPHPGPLPFRSGEGESLPGLGVAHAADSSVTINHPLSSIFHLPSSFCYWLSILFFALGLMSKPMLVTLPFILLLLDVWPLGRWELKTQNLKLRTLFPLVAEKVPFLALSALSSILTFLAQQRGGAVAALTTVPLGLRLENALISCVTYLEKTLWPAGLAAYYPLPSAIAPMQVVFAIAVLVAISVTALRTFRQRPYFGIGWLWYLGMLIPVIGLVQVGAQSHADRYTYLPLIGLFIAITWGATESLALSPISNFQFRRLIALLAAAALFACALGTHSQTLVWHDSETLYRHALAVTTDNAFVHSNLGNELLKQQQYDEAVEHFAEAVKIDPRQPEPRGSWAFVVAAQGKLDEAVGLYRSAIELEPNRALTHFLLGNTLMSQHKRQEAVTEYRTALRLEPALWQAHTELGTALAQDGKVDQAIQEFETALGISHESMTTERAVPPHPAPLPQGEGSGSGRSLAPPEGLRPKPDYARAHQQYGMLLARTGKLSQAERHLREAIRLNPDLQTYQELALVLTAAGQPDAAIAEYREALRLRPDSPATLNNLAWLLAASSKDTVRDGSEAVKLAEQACKLTRFQEPIFVGTLAAAYAEARQFPDAVSAAEKAIALALSAGQKQVAERNQQLLELYRAGKPFHETPTKSSQTTDEHSAAESQTKRVK